MVNKDDKNTVKKPVPLPRKSLHKQNKIAPVEEDEENSSMPQKKTEGKVFVRDDWKSASGSFVFEKGRQMKSEVQKLEKSVKNIISRRRSLHSKNQKGSLSEPRSESLPDDSILFNISFNSPLTDDEKQSDSQSISCSEDISFYENDLGPPPYPPPELPDESVYDTMRSCSLSDQQSCKSTSSDSNSIYEDLPMSHDTNITEYCKSDFIKNENSESSTSFSDEGHVNRYESVKNFIGSGKELYKTLPDIPESDILSLNSAKENFCESKDQREISHIKYIIHLFDPLTENNLKASELIGNSEKKFSNELLDIEKKGNLFKDIKNVDVCKSDVVSSSSEDFKILPSIIEEGHYGKIQKTKKLENNYVGLKSNNDRYSLLEPPPIPPRRMDNKDSFQIDGSRYKCSEKKVDPKCDNISLEEKSKSSDILQWSSLKRVAKIVVNNIESRASYISLPGKKGGKLSSEDLTCQNAAEQKTCGSCLLPQSFPKHSGVLVKPGGIQRWGVLSQRKLTLFTNKDSPDVKETVPMDGVLSVETTHNKIGVENVGVYCFEVSISSRTQPLLFGVPSVSERHIWMRKLVESIGRAFPAKLSMDYTKAGWCYAKESVSCAWIKYYILLHQRNLYLSTENGSLITADLRKARKISLQTEGFTCEIVTEKGPLMLIDLQDRTLYLQMDYERETKAWEETIKAAALKNGPTLYEQQLTKDDVPAIVDKCLNFIHTHGSFSEGIYRRNGSNRTVSQLLAAFRCNAWSVQLAKENCSEFDVSSVLKRYFRDLPEPLLVPEIYEELGTVLKIEDHKEKIEKYKVALKKLPDINYLTTRRLMGHLHFINKQKEKNLMGADNLAAVWGPTLMQVQEEISLDAKCFKIEALVINDLIAFYPEIFDVKESEVEREMKILKMLESYHNNSNTLSKKPSGELKIWVYLHSAKNVDGCVNVSINPHKTAEEVCKELSYKTNDPVHLLCLEEVVCNGHLTRPLNHSEKVLETVLRWSYWDEADRKDNCLVLTKNNLFQEVLQSAKFPVIICEELKFADQKSKTFKSYQFEFSQAKLFCFKDKSCSQKIAEWKVEDIVWYFGHEPKRVPQTRWSITFIEKHNMSSRSKEKPFFGNTLGGSSEEQKFKLVSAMLMAQYAKDILPIPNFME